MPQRTRSVVLAATVLVALAAFSAGRYSAKTSPSEGTSAHAGKDGDRHSFSVQSSVSPASDIGKATIENIGQVEFDQGYQFLRSASAEQLAQWTARLEALPTSPRKTAGIASFFRILTQADTKTAVELAMKLQGRESRLTAIQTVYGATPEANVADLARLGTGADDPNVDRGDLVSRWSLTDPVSAARFAEEHLANVDTYWLGNLLENWATLDPAAAEAWLESLDPSQRETSVVAGFYSGWFARDRDAALNHLVAHAVGASLAAVLEKVGPTTFHESPDAARALISRFPDVERQKAVLSSVARGADARYLSGDAPYSAEGVAKWLVTMPGDLADDSLGDVVSNWSSQSPETVANWMKGMSTELHDRVAASFCRDINWSEPARNLNAGFEITDSHLRKETFRALLKTFATRKVARDYVRQAKLPPGQAFELEQMLTEL